MVLLMFTTACLPDAPRSMKAVWCAIFNTLTGLKTIVQPMQLPLLTSSECCKRHNASWVVDPSSYMTGLPIHPYICHLYRLALPPCELQVCWSDLSSQLPYPPLPSSLPSLSPHPFLPSPLILSSIPSLPYPFLNPLSPLSLPRSPLPPSPLIPPPAPVWVVQEHSVCSVLYWSSWRWRVSWTSSSPSTHSDNSSRASSALWWGFNLVIQQFV